MHETLFQDAMFGPCVLTFDGHAVEVFRSSNANSIWRSHRWLIALAPIGPPHRKGFVEVSFLNRHNRSEVFTMRVPTAELPTLQPVLDAIG